MAKLILNPDKDKQLKPQSINIYKKSIGLKKYLKISIGINCVFFATILYLLIKYR